MSLFDQNNYKTGDGVTPTVSSIPREFSGCGFVVLNTSQNRDIYIENCYRTNTVTLITTQLDIVKNCIVPVDIWNKISFPKDNSEFGSYVSWVSLYKHDIIIVVDVLGKKQDFVARKEEDFIQERKTSGASFKSHGNGLKGSYLLSVEGKGKEAGQIRIKALNPNLTALFDLHVQGLIEIESDISIDIKSKKEFNLTVRDDSNKTDKGIDMSLKDKHFSLKNEQVSLFKIMKDILMMYMKTKTIDGKSLDPGSVNKATSLIKDLSKILK